MTHSEVALVLGTRPEIIKMAPVIRAYECRGIAPALIHTGQHYSDELDAMFFRQLDLPAPTVNLEVGSGTHGEQTGEMLAGVERTLLETDPEVVFVQGDTNSALAGALAGSKLDTEVAHVEAGLRSFDREMPEETNRVLIDHVSDHCFAPTEQSAELLRREGISDETITVTGNTVVDAVTRCSELAAEASTIHDDLGIEPNEYCLLTAHRAENVDDRDRFESLLAGVDQFAQQSGLEVVYPIHPRAREQIAAFDIAVPESIRLVEPLDFFDFLQLEEKAALAFTDSGGVQEETCILGTPCVTLRYNTERPETAIVGANCIAGLNPADISAAATRMVSKAGDWEAPFGDGLAGERIVASLDTKSSADPQTARASGEK
jgi:UDP-N-acetylglucosamine 2-epimerase (non-hydrolysing)